MKMINVRVYRITQECNENNNVNRESNFKVNLHMVYHICGFLTKS